MLPNLLTWTQTSPTLELVNDLLRFVTGFFEVISTSAPHIYHSALPLSPQTSAVWRLYKQYAHLLVRIVKGVPTSWDLAMATFTHPYYISSPTWSPCSRFIAISILQDQKTPLEYEVSLLDAVTFKRLKSFTLSYPLLSSPSFFEPLFAFSPNGQLLTWSNPASGEHVSWDLQTGVPVSRIPIEMENPIACACSITYSLCGTMFGVLFMDDYAVAISTYNILSSACIYHHPIEGKVVGTIWTHGECIQFATFVPGSITVWEVGFTSIGPATEIKFLPTPSNLDPSKDIDHLFLPTCSRLAFILGETIVIWDAHCSKLLLNTMDVKNPENMNFSSDGHFFACGTNVGREIYLWKESPTGYTLYQKFTSENVDSSQPILSPNGQSIVGCNSNSLQLWHIAGSTTSLSNVQIQTPQNINGFIVRFSPDRSLVAAARIKDSVVTVTDLKSGATRLTISTGMEICGLGVTGSTIIVVGLGQAITWDLPAWDHTLNARINIGDGVQTAVFNYSAPFYIFTRTWSASVSPDFEYIAFSIKFAGGISFKMYSTFTGKLIYTLSKRTGHALWFTPDGNEFWCCSSQRGWAIIKDGESNITKLKYLGPNEKPSGGYPWESSHGLQIANGWILSSSGKQLLWLPYHLWPTDECEEFWDGQFLAIVCGKLPEVFILEFLEDDL